MLQHLTKHWGFVAIRGVAALLFGALTIAMPGIALVSLIFLFGVYTMADGILHIVASFRGGGSVWAMLLGGIVSIAAALVMFIRPDITAVALLYVIAFWAIFKGVFEIVVAIRLRKELDREWMLILAGVISILFGGLLLAAPVAGALAVVLWIGVFAVIEGFLLLLFAFRLRGVGRHLTGEAPSPAGAR